MKKFIFVSAIALCASSPAFAQDAAGVASNDFTGPWVALIGGIDAMTTTRPYRQALSEAEARRRLLEGVGQQWDARVVSAFIRWLDSSAATRPSPALPRSRLATVASSR